MGFLKYSSDRVVAVVFLFCFFFLSYGACFLVFFCFFFLSVIDLVELYTWIHQHNAWGLESEAGVKTYPSGKYAAI